jgi:Zn-dependent protease
MPLLPNLTSSDLIAYTVILLVAFPLHEFAHAWTATQFGDNTPRLNGRLTLNPLAHLDLMGSLLLLFARFGWAKPVPVNPYALERRSPAALMWVSLAGPLTNLILAILAAIPFRLGLLSVTHGFAPSTGLLPNFDYIMVTFIYINLLLALFNMIPLAPLDGEKIATYFLPPSIGRYFDIIRPYGPMILLLLVFAGSLLGFNLIGQILGPPLTFLFGLLVG